MASTASLQSALLPAMEIERVGTDRYGRTLATIGTAVGDLSCLQLKRGHAIYRQDWDDRSRIADRCPDAIPD